MARNAAHYVLDNGPILKDGDTFGLTADERIAIRHSGSMWNEVKQVIRLVP